VARHVLPDVVAEPRNGHSPMSLRAPTWGGGWSSMESASSVSFMLPSLVALWLSGAGHARIHRIGRLEANALRRYRVDSLLSRLSVPCARCCAGWGMRTVAAWFKLKGVLRTGSRR
jgi:hypothetical protein